MTERKLLRMFPALLGTLLLFTLAPGQVHAHPAPQQNSASQAATDSAPAVTVRPASAPVVTYENGQLTIVAENATLADIMSGLRHAMGTEIDLPAGSSGERIWAHLGPGSAHKVLSDLLANTDLNYIIQGAQTDTAAIQSVTLSVRTLDTGAGRGSPVETAASRHGARIVPQPAPEPEPAPVPQETAATAPVAPTASPAPQGADSPSPATTAAAAATTSADATSTSGAAAPDAPMPSAPVSASMTPTGPSNVYPQTPQPSAGSFDPHPTPPASMSTEEVVQQLSNMYQQRRQMQRSQSGSPN